MPAPMYFVNYDSGNWTIDAFDGVDMLHASRDATVFLARHRDTSELYAFKEYNFRALGSMEQSRVDQEVDIHARLGRHPNIVQLVGVFKSDYRQYVVTKFARGGTLADVIRWRRHALQIEPCFETLREYAVPVLTALKYMHDAGFVHRDVKPENIVYDADGVVKLIDFGLASRVGDIDIWGGTDAYMAPEVSICKKAEYPRFVEVTTKMDSWSAGVTIFELIMGRLPCAEEFDSWPDSLSRSWFCAALHPDPECRATVSELLKHPWLGKISPRTPYL